MKITFSTKDVIDTILAENGIDAILDDPFEFSLNGIVSSIPKGFQFDWASIPQVLWGIFPKMGLHSWGTLIHDWLYKTQEFNNKPCSKAFADVVFREVMKYYGVSLWRRNTMYYAVRIFGQSAWKTNRKSEVQEK